jgi:hypothetical protein
VEIIMLLGIVIVAAFTIFDWAMRGQTMTNVFVLIMSILAMCAILEKML